MKKFRLGALTLAAMLLLTAFTSCNDSEDSKGTESKSDNGTEISGTTADGDGNASGNVSADGSEGLKFELNSDGTAYAVSGFEGSLENYSVVIPDTYNGLPVTSIAEKVFWKCDGLTDITIPDSITELGPYVFQDCTGIVRVTIPKNVITVGNGIFSGCNGLESITVSENNEYYYSSGNCLIENATNTLVAGCKNSVIPDSVTVIAASAFYACDTLTSIIIPKSVTEIGLGAFSGCAGLESITIPNNVIKISKYAFSACVELKNAVFENQSGWSVEGTSVDLSDSELNAQYLIGSSKDYCGKTWRRIVDE